MTASSGARATRRARDRPGAGGRRSVGLSAAEARRVALAAQGFARARPTGRVDRRHVRRLLGDIGLVQIDSVNVLVRSQELPLFARLGPHDRSLLPAMTDAAELFEYWAHEASHLPMTAYPLFRWRMDDAEGHAWKGVVRMQREHPGFIEQVLATVAERGPVVAGDLRTRTGPKGTWWDWDHGKLALEWLFWSGRLTARRRMSDFARVYDLADRVIPREVRSSPVPSRKEAHRELLMRAAAHHGVATAKDLADYHRLSLTECGPLLTELVEDGRLLEADVEGWGADRRSVAYLHPEATMPRRVDARALLSPFDPVVWERSRAERLFGFRYRIEIYTPQAKRVHGYYVLPFLLGDRLVGRVDLKADRARSVLVVQSAWHEPGCDTPEVVEELAAELAVMARWLGLARVEVTGRGDLGPALRRAVQGR
jgi:hypothetical protein